MAASQSFDYVIIGGGTAGLVVANRLTEDSTCSVVVLEAGENHNDDPKITIPGLGTSTYNDDNYDWQFQSTPQDSLHGKTVDLSRGKLVGGSSAINVLAMIYPHRSTIDAWEHELGNPGWGFDTLSQYYTKAISTQKPSEKVTKDLNITHLDPKYHSDIGPIQTSFPTFYRPFTTSWIPTMKKLGLLTTADPKSGEGYGAYTSQASIDSRNAERSHAGSAYFKPVASRPNLTLLTKAMVEKLLIKPGHGDSDAIVEGVQYSKDGKTRVVTAKREYILSAGVFQTPQLLELSGIGDPKILERHGIKTIVANPFVGENLQDHPLSGLCFEVKDGVATTDMIRDPAVVKKAMEMYQINRSGPLASPFGGCAALLPVAEWTTQTGKKELRDLIQQYAKLEESSAIGGSVPLPSLAKQYSVHYASIENPEEGSIWFGLASIQMHFDKVSQKDIFAVSDPGNYALILAALTSPLSRGSTHIASADPYAKPEINPRYLSHPLDVEIFARQIRFIEKIASTAPLSEFLKEDGSRLPKGYDVSTVDKAKDHITRHVISNNHGASSCSMMPREIGGVVDHELRVYGVQGLRIVDASIMPMIPKGNIQSSVYAVAEKAADLIRGDFRPPSSRSTHL